MCIICSVYIFASMYRLVFSVLISCVLSHPCNVTK
ncbi:hypothetical protein EUBVEN_02732 [Eubacterium ventriosum ATCC 27560]|uniref:Uncharacterized protein n=1 Tax=Eubacterium ventriosum ATCC 27560 TaxID=411463 RepID=A5ZAI5_9FIRM|nr:hypothetical protein EUBVEN_02732 [Eubacterium ventriosum ATCC 27560]